MKRRLRRWLRRGLFRGPPLFFLALPSVGGGETGRILRTRPGIRIGGPSEGGLD